MMAKITQNKWFYRFLSLAFALMIFFIANSHGRVINLPVEEEEYENTVENVPIELKYDDEKYFISGYPTTTKVHLKSSNRILLNTETNEQTRSFKVVADLSHYKEGTVEVPLKVEETRNGVTTTVVTETIPVTIEKRVEKTFKVEPVIDTSNLPEGYQVSSLVIDPEEVKVSTGNKTVESIEHVIVAVNIQQNQTGTFTETVDVQALNKEGQNLAIVADPQQVEVTVSLKSPSKKVSVVASQIGTLAEGIQYYSFALSQETVEITGEKTELDKISQLEIPINVSGIKETVVKKIKLPLPQGITAGVTEISVTITPTLRKNESSSNQSASNQNSQPTDSSSSTTSSSSMTEEDESKGTDETNSTN